MFVCALLASDKFNLQVVLWNGSVCDHTTGMYREEVACDDCHYVSICLGSLKKIHILVVAVPIFQYRCDQAALKERKT